MPLKKFEEDLFIKRLQRLLSIEDKDASEESMAQLVFIYEFLTENPKLTNQLFKFISAMKNKDDGNQAKLIEEWLREGETKYTKKAPEGFNWEEEISEKDYDRLSENNKKFTKNAENIWDLGQGSVTVGELAQYIKRCSNKDIDTSKTEANIRKMLRDERLIGYKLNPGKKSTWYIPLWQVNKKTGQIFDGIRELRSIFSQDSFMLQQFIVTCRERDDGNSMLELLAEGRIEDVISYARIYEES